jgi:hypothetical protein
LNRGKQFHANRHDVHLADGTENSFIQIGMTFARLMVEAHHFSALNVLPLNIYQCRRSPCHADLCETVFVWAISQPDLCETVFLCVIMHLRCKCIITQKEKQFHTNRHHGCTCRCTGGLRHWNYWQLILAPGYNCNVVKHIIKYYVFSCSRI